MIKSILKILSAFIDIFNFAKKTKRKIEDEKTEAELDNILNNNNNKS